MLTIPMRFRKCLLSLHGSKCLIGRQQELEEVEEKDNEKEGEEELVYQLVSSHYPVMGCYNGSISDQSTPPLPVFSNTQHPSHILLLWFQDFLPPSSPFLPSFSPFFSSVALSSSWKITLERVIFFLLIVTEDITMTVPDCKSQHKTTHNDPIMTP